MLDPDGDAVEVFIFESEDLPNQWPRLDEFEGDQYARLVTEAETEHGSVAVSIYALCD